MVLQMDRWTISRCQPPGVCTKLAIAILGVVLLGASARAAPTSPVEKKSESDSKDSKDETKTGFRTSLIPGEETYEPLDQPLSTEEAEKLEAKKLLVVGYMQIQQRKLNQALHTLETALKHDPGSPTILKELAYLCYQLDRSDDALEYSRRALEAMPDEYELWHAYGLRHRELRNFDAAIGALEQASKVAGLKTKDPDTFFEIRLELADLYDVTANKEGVVTAMQDVIDFVDNPQKYAIDAQLARSIERNRVTLYRKYASALKTVGRIEEAMAALERGQDASDSGQLIAGDLAEIYFETGNYEKAQEELKKYLRVADERGLVLYEKVLEKLGKKDELLDSLKSMVERDSENASLRKFYGERLLDAGKFEQAREQLLKVRGRPDMLPILTRLYREMNQPKELLQAFTESMTTPNGQEALPAQIRALGSDKDFLHEVAEAAREMKNEEDREVPKFFADYIVARAAREAKDVALGKEFYERCIAERPEASALYLELVQLLLTEKQYEDVVEVCQRAIDKKVPGEFEFYDEQARALELLGKTDQAVETIEKLIARLGDGDAVVEANVVLAWIYQHAKQYDKAEEVCQRVITEFPGVRRIPYVRYLLSNIYTLGGDQGKAEVQLQLLLETDPQTIPRELVAAANNDLGYLWADEGKNLDQAEKMIRRALEINPDSAPYLDSLGWVLFKAGKYAEAVDYLKQATEQESGQDAVIWDHLGDAYRKLENFEEARKAWEKAVELYGAEDSEKEAEKMKSVQQKIDFLDVSPDGPTPNRAQVGDP